MTSSDSPTRKRRLKRIAEGAEAGKAWLEAMFRSGLGSGSVLEGFSDLEKRMVDSQAAGLARKFRMLSELRNTSEDWQDRFVEEAGLLYLLLDSFLRLDSFPEVMQQEIMRTVGITVDARALDALPVQEDLWDLVVQREFKEGRLVARRSWCYGRSSQRWVCFQQYRIVTQPFEPNLMLGHGYRMALTMYPGSAQTRAAVKSHERIELVPPLGGSFDNTAKEYADLLVRFPWAEQVAGSVCISGLAQECDNWYAQDLEGTWFPIKADSLGIWRVVAYLGSKRVTLFGEWDGREFYASSVSTEAGFVGL